MKVLHLRRFRHLSLGALIAFVGAYFWLSGSTGAGHFVAFAVWAAALLAPGALYRRTVTINHEGLTLRRGSAGRFFCPWSEIVGVERRRLWPFAVDQLQLRKPVRRHVSYSSTNPPEVTWRPTSNKRVFIALYDRNWRTGPIGAAMTARGISLQTRTPRPNSVLD